MTLVELIVCVSLLAALIGLAIPSFSQLLSERRRDSAIRDFTGDLQLARSMALRTSRAVVMCVTQDGVACDLGVNTNDWRQGWIVFSDLDGNSLRGQNEPVFVQRGPLIGMQLMQSTTANGRIALRSNGLLNSGQGTVSVLPSGSSGQTPTGTGLRELLNAQADQTLQGCFRGS